MIPIVIYALLVPPTIATSPDNDYEGEEEITLFKRYTGLNTSLLARIVVSYYDFLGRASSSSAATRTVTIANSFLSRCGVPHKSFLTNDEFVISLLTTAMTLLAYYLVMGKAHVRKRKALEEGLRTAQRKVEQLEEELVLARAEENGCESNSRNGGNKEVRIFMDGAFDVMHYGHMNAFRLGRSLGTHLIVGVNSDESISRCKGSPLMNDAERLTMVEGCKFVDAVIPGCPYVMSPGYLKYVIEKFNIDYVVHGDDPCIVDGKDVYASAKEAGRYQSISRTEGVSTTDIVGRMLTMTKKHHVEGDDIGAGDGTGAGDSNGGMDGENRQRAMSISSSSIGDRLLCEQSKFLTTSRMLRLFSAGMKAPEKGMRVVYIDGAWDMFHCGHVAILQKAKQRGDYLVVGVHGDSTVNRRMGANLPLMNLHERVLSVLGCRHADDVLIDAPSKITQAMITSLTIAEVVRGTVSSSHVKDEENRETVDDGVDDSGSDYSGFDLDDDLSERYRCPKELGIFTTIRSSTDFNLGSVVSRIQANQKVFDAKIARKKKAEKDFYIMKHGEDGHSKVNGTTAANNTASIDTNRSVKLKNK